MQIQALEKSSFDSPSVLAIVILPYTERSRCDQTLKSVFVYFKGEVFPLAKFIIV